MNTLNYIGSKHTLFNTILKIFNENIPEKKNLTFMDMFAGTGTIGFHIQDYFKSVCANDLEQYSYIINCALLQCNYSPKLQQIIDDCNTFTISTPSTVVSGVPSLPGAFGYGSLQENNDLTTENLIYKNYSPNDTCERMFFTSENAKKCDIIRVHIEKLFTFSKEITVEEYRFLLASLIVSTDKRANTTSVYGAYLKQYKKSALKPIILTPIHKKTNIVVSNNSVFNMLAESITEKCDVVYIDPPYNQRQYAANYSPLNYIAQYNSEVVLTGKTGLIKDYNKSKFCSKPQVKTVFIELIQNIQCRYIIMSYNNEGLLDIDTLKTILKEKGDVKLYKIQYNKFKAQQNVAKKHTEEYVWFVDTGKKNGIIEEITISVI